MVKLRQDKIDVIADFIPKLEIYGNPKGELLVLSWGGTYGACRAAVEKAYANNISVAHVNLKYINPFPKNLAEILLKFNKVNFN